MDVLLGTAKENENEVTSVTLPHLKCIRLVSVCSSLPCIYIGVRIELTKRKTILPGSFSHYTQSQTWNAFIEIWVAFVTLYTVNKGAC